jgi:hypothetical protein
MTSPGLAHSRGIAAAAFRATGSVYPTLMTSSDSLDTDVLTLAV